MSYQRSTPSFHRVAAAFAFTLAAASAQAQFVRGVDSNFESLSLTTANSGVNASTVAGTHWILNNLTAGGDYGIFGTGDNNPNSPDPTAAGGSRYLGIRDNRQAAIQLTPSTFTGISGNFNYSLGFLYSTVGATGQAVGFGWRIVSATSASQVFSGATAQGWLGTEAHTVQNLGNLSGTVTGQNRQNWATFSQVFSLNTSPTNYTDKWLVLSANNTTPQNFLAIDNVTAVPEPETYAMLLAGLGAIGFMSRRRRAEG